MCDYFHIISHHSIDYLSTSCYFHQVNPLPSYILLAVRLLLHLLLLCHPLWPSPPFIPPSHLASGLHLLPVPITTHCSLPLYLAGWHLGNPVCVWVPRPCWTQPGSPVWSAPAHLAAAAGKWWGLGGGSGNGASGTSECVVMGGNEEVWGYGGESGIEENTTQGQE